MTVWVVIEVDYDSTKIVGIYLNKSDAEKEKSVSDGKPQEIYQNRECIIEEHEVK